MIAYVQASVCVCSMDGIHTYKWIVEAVLPYFLKIILLHIERRHMHINKYF